MCYGLTLILCYGKIFDKIRPKHRFFKCPMCVGFWAGLIVYGFSFFSRLITFELDWGTPILLGLLSSGTSYILCSLFDDNGLKLEVENEYSCDD